MKRALDSVLEQTVPADEVHVIADSQHDGPAVTRNRALFASKCEFTLFLDDDDELEPNAIERLLACARNTDADVVYPWFTIRGQLGRSPANGQMLYAKDPFPEMFGKEFDAAELETRNFIPITTLVRTDMAKNVGGIPEPGDTDWPHKTNEDWGFWRRMVRADAKIVHLPERLWRWNIHHTEMPHYTGQTW